MTQKSIIIIGSGIAGLSAGCYGRMCGYQTTIFEKHDKPGGLCTSWKRNGYTINGCLAFVIGSGPNTAYHEMWRELGVVQAVRMLDYDYFMVVQAKDGREVGFPMNIDKLEQTLLEIAPEDERLIRKLIKGTRIWTKYGLPVEKAPELLSFGDKMKFMLTHFPMLRAMGRWKKVSLQELGTQFKNPLLRETIPALTSWYAASPTLLRQVILAYGHMKSAGYPMGGSLEFSLAIARRYEQLGGRLRLGAEVREILVEDNRAVGVLLADGTRHRADHVISTADGRSTLFSMLGGKYVCDKVRRYYEGGLPTFSPLVSVALGVNRTFPDFPLSAYGKTYLLREPARVAGMTLERIIVWVYNFDPSLAPKGKTVVKVLLGGSYEHWKSLAADPKRYASEKETVGKWVVDQLDERFPGLAAQVEMVDVATPVTWERYTAAWKGSALGWDSTPQTAFMPIMKTVPGLDGFFMAGQWVEVGGGVPFVAASGRNVLQLVCKRDNNPFVTNTP
jgi:phytoene dehydrogenase-like protein